MSENDGDGRYCSSQSTATRVERALERVSHLFNQKVNKASWIREVFE